jgi:hypothetical protein
MAFDIFIHKIDQINSSYMFHFKTSNMSLRSAPQDITNCYMDLKINSDLLKCKKLSKFFICNEPMFNIEYEEDKLILYTYQMHGSSQEILSEFCDFWQLSSQIDGMAKGLATGLAHCGIDIEEANENIKNDLLEGVYDFFQ